jgi:hypothetical protein
MEPASRRMVGLGLTKRERHRSDCGAFARRLLRKKGSFMFQTIRTLTLACAVFLGAAFSSAYAAEREQVRMVINLVAGVKMPFPRNLQNNQSRTERVQLDTNSATVACLRLDDKVRWCFEHIAPVGARAEMLRITNEPVAGLLVGQLFSYVDDFDLDGSVDIGSTTKLDGQPHAPVGVVSQFVFRGIGRGEQFRGDYQKLYDEGIQIALKYLGE